MTNVGRALYNFWSSFGLNAYPEDTVPDNVETPYITYSIRQPDWADPDSLYARVWYRSDSYTGVMAKVDEIGRKLESGYSVPTDDGGCVILMKDSNFAQFQPYEVDPNMKVAYLSLIMHAFTG